MIERMSPLSPRSGLSLRSLALAACGVQLINSNYKGFTQSQPQDREAPFIR